MLIGSVLLLAGAASLALAARRSPLGRPGPSAQRAVAALACQGAEVAPEGVSRRALLAAAAAGVAAAGGALPAFAEATLVTRQQAYTRYVPRVERARDFWAGRLRGLVAKSDWETIQKELAPLGKKGEGGTLRKLVSPMRLWASSFSSKTISDKTQAMEAAVDEIEDAIASLDVASKGEVKGGIFGFLGGTKKVDESQRGALAQAAYKKGVSAFNKYIEIGNDGIGVSFEPLDTI